jgi:hypothetical protein
MVQIRPIRLVALLALLTMMVLPAVGNAAYSVHYGLFDSGPFAVAVPMKGQSFRRFSWSLEAALPLR